MKIQSPSRDAVAAGVDPSLGHKNHNLRIMLTAGLLLVLLLLLGFAFHAQILTGLADTLIVEDRLQPADAILLLNGDFETRPFRAAELYLQGFAPLVIIARAENKPVVELGLEANDTDIAVGVMEKLGVPHNKIIVLPVPGGTTSTFDEAGILKQYIEANPVHKVILVTSAFHTRRARWIFEKAFAGLPLTLEMAAAPYIGFDRTNWWKNEDGLITLNNEYIKLAYYLIKYR